MSDTKELKSLYVRNMSEIFGEIYGEIICLGFPLKDWNKGKKGRK